jgi:hypothetical protein
LQATTNTSWSQPWVTAHSMHAVPPACNQQHLSGYDVKEAQADMVFGALFHLVITVV